MPKTPQEIMTSYDPMNDDEVKRLCIDIDQKLEHDAYRLSDSTWGYRIVFVFPRHVLGHKVRAIARIYMEHGWRVRVYEGTQRDPDMAIEFKLPEGIV